MKHTDYVRNAGVVMVIGEDFVCCIYLPAVITSSQLESAQHSVITALAEVKNIYNIVHSLSPHLTDFFFLTIVNSIYKNTQLDLKYFEINPRCHQTAENISYQTFFVSLSSGLSLVSHVLWGVISLSLLTRDPDLSDEETKITQPDP